MYTFTYRPRRYPRGLRWGLVVFRIIQVGLDGPAAYVAFETQWKRHAPRERVWSSVHFNFRA